MEACGRKVDEPRKVFACEMIREMFLQKFHDGGDSEKTLDYITQIFFRRRYLEKAIQQLESDLLPPAGGGDPRRFLVDFGK